MLNELFCFRSETAVKLITMVSLCYKREKRIESQLSKLITAKPIYCDRVISCQRIYSAPQFSIGFPCQYGKLWLPCTHCTRYKICFAFPWKLTFICGFNNSYRNGKNNDEKANEPKYRKYEGNDRITANIDLPADVESQTLGLVRCIWINIQDSNPTMLTFRCIERRVVRPALDGDITFPNNPFFNARHLAFSQFIIKIHIEN